METELQSSKYSLNSGFSLFFSCKGESQMHQLHLLAASANVSSEILPSCGFPGYCKQGPPAVWLHSASQHLDQLAFLLYLTFVFSCILKNLKLFSFEILKSQASVKKISSQKNNLYVISNGIFNFLVNLNPSIIRLFFKM